MSLHTYALTLENGRRKLDLKALNGEVKSALPGKKFRLRSRPKKDAEVDPQVEVDFHEDTLTTAEITTLDTTVSDNQTATDTLDALKAECMKDIDDHSRGLFAAGVTHGGDLFSTSMAAQARMNDYVTLDDATQLDYPVRWPLKDNSGEGSFGNKVALKNFAQAMFDRVRAVEDGGLDLKVSIRAATTQAELDAVVDTRT